MSIRRRRKTLTNLLSTIDRRVTAVELRPINLLTSGQADAALDDNEDLDAGLGAVVSLNAPNQYKKVTDGYYYSPRQTGTRSRAEIYFDADPGLKKDLTVRVSGVHQLIAGGSVVSIPASGDFRTIASNKPPFEGRESYDGTRHTPPEGTAATVLYNPNVGTEYSGRRVLIVNRRISMVESTTTTAKITFTATNYFKVNDVVFVDMPTDTPFYGLDGLYRVKSVGSNFITFDFSSPLEEPINQTSVTEERFVSAVAQSAVRDGATWVDTSTTPDTVYVWKDIRWVLFNTQTDVPRDRVAPSDVTNVTTSDENDTPDGSAIGLRRITLNWDAPTTNEDGTSLDDLVGYTIWWRQRQSQEWEKADFNGAETTWSRGNFEQNKRAYFKIFARDSGGNRSEGVEVSHLAGKSEPTVQQPKAPTVTTYLGTIKIAYDDETVSGNLQPGTAKEIEVYFSDVVDFVPGPSNYYGKFPANAGSYIIIPGTELVDNTDYYVRIIVRDVFGNITPPSDPPIAIRARLSNIVTYDMIDVGTLTGQVIIGADIRTSSNPSVIGGIIMNQQGLTAYDADGNQTFRINATTGAVTIGNYLSTDQAAGLYLGKQEADNKFATQVTANGIKITADNAKSTADSANAAAGTANNKLEDITELTAGGLRIRKAKTIQSLNIGSLTLSNNTTRIDGGVIQAGTILANQIGDGTLPVGVIYAGVIDAGRITTGTLVGRTIRTNAADGLRVAMNATQNAFQVFNSAGTLVGKVDGGSTSGYGMRLLNAANNEYISLYNGGVDIQGDNVGINIRPSATKSSSTIVLDAGRISVTKFTSDIGVANGFGIVTAFRGVGLNQGSLNAAYLGGTNIGVLQVGSGGYPSRTNLSGTGTRTVLALNTGTLTASTSDGRLKKNIQTLDVGLDFIDKLKPKKFVFKNEPDMIEYGLIAQEVRQALLDLGIKDNTNLVFEDSSEEKLAQLPEGESGPVLGVEYMKLIPILLNSVKELKHRIEILEKEGDN